MLGLQVCITTPEWPSLKINYIQKEKRVHTHMNSHNAACMEVKGQVKKAGSFLLPHGSQAWQQVPLLTEPFCQPLGLRIFYVLVVSLTFTS